MASVRQLSYCAGGEARHHEGHTGLWWGSGAAPVPKLESATQQCARAAGSLLSPWCPQRSTGRAGSPGQLH